MCIPCCLAPGAAYGALTVSFATEVLKSVSSTGFFGGLSVRCDCCKLWFPAWPYIVECAPTNSPSSEFGSPFLSLSAEVIDEGVKCEGWFFS